MISYFGSNHYSNLKQACTTFTNNSSRFILPHYLSKINVINQFPVNNPII